jgi:crotonobetainyl-CoA:carnitine CoA-transferase CaiB-like acyl-CoA transferase
MKPVDNTTVLDLTRLSHGAVAMMTLGDFGADIIKIEERRRKLRAMRNIRS